MDPENDEYRFLDDFNKGLLTDEEIKLLRQKMDSDEAFRKKAEEYFELINAVKVYGRRKTLKEALGEIHSEIENPHTKVNDAQSSRWKKYSPLTAVAASVALISILGTLFITQYFEKKQSAYYKELRRNVDQLKKSQNKIIADITESKEKTIFPSKYSGTGFLISSNGYVATSYHVIKEADSIIIENEMFGRLHATIVHNDPLNDISILKIDDKDLSAIRSLPFTFASQEANLGEYVYTLGFPREDIVFGEGSVSASTGFRQNPNAYQISIPVNPGNSGGPMLNDKGNLIGMISGIQTETSGATFAIKSSILLDVLNHESLDTLRRPLRLSRNNTLKDMSRVNQIKKWKEFVFMIRVYNNK